MHVASQDTPVSRRWAQSFYLVLAGLILVGIFLQGFLIGAFLFGDAIWGRSAHSFMGLILLVLSLVLALVGLLAELPGKMKAWGFLLFVLVMFQFVLPSTRGNTPLVAALHPAYARILFGVSLCLSARTRQLTRVNA